MFSHPFYNLVHIVGLILLMSALGGIALQAVSTSASGRVRWALWALHGAGLFLILLGGFGMLARLGIVQGSSWPLWVWVKVGVWATLGATALLPYRWPRTALPLFLVLPALGGLAAYMAIYKPG